MHDAPYDPASPQLLSTILPWTRHGLQVHVSSPTMNHWSNQDLWTNSLKSHLELFSISHSFRWFFGYYSVCSSCVVDGFPGLPSYVTVQVLTSRWYLWSHRWRIYPHTDQKEPQVWHQWFFTLGANDNFCPNWLWWGSHPNGKLSWSLTSPIVNCVGKYYNPYS